MKKVSTLFSLLIALGVVYAQQPQAGIDKSEYTRTHSPKKVISFPKKQAQQGNRNSVSAVMIDYAGVDDAYATAIGTDFYYDPTLDINNRYPNSSTFTHKYAAQVYDSILYLDGSNMPTFFPRAKTTLTVDSVDLYFIHTHTTNNPDSIRITIFDRSQLNITGSGPTAVLVTPTRWDTLIVTNTQIPLNVNNGGTPTWTGITLYPNIAYNLGETFGIRVDFSGDTANKFFLQAGFRDDCANACVAAESAANNPNGLPNSLYYINAITGGGQNISGINSIQFNCDPLCNQWTAQNWWIYPWITADVQYSAAITADSVTGCPGTVLNLNAFGFGSTATPFTYQWSTGSGTLSSTTDQNVSLIVDQSTTVTVTVTDATNATTTATINITSRGIGVSVTPNPVTLNCGASTTLVAQTSGNQSGRTYAWSTGGTTLSVNVNTAGTYSVTVTNNSGCSASVSVPVSYPGGVANAVNFTYTTPVCQNQSKTYTNTSQYSTSPWTSLWDMGNGDLVNTTDANYTYASPGQYTVKLTMDSANCKFSFSRTVNVLAATNALCTGSGIDDVSFDNAITLQPNPSNGNFTMTVNGVERNITVRVYNIIGSEVKTFRAGDVNSVFTKTFDFSDLSNGTYLVKVQTAEKLAIKRITISR